MHLVKTIFFVCNSLLVSGAKLRGLMQGGRNGITPVAHRSWRFLPGCMRSESAKRRHAGERHVGASRVERAPDTLLFYPPFDEASLTIERASVPRRGASTFPAVVGGERFVIRVEGGDLFPRGTIALDEGQQQFPVDWDLAPAEGGFADGGKVGHEAILIEEPGDRPVLVATAEMLSIKHELTRIWLAELCAGLVVNNLQQFPVRQHQIGDADDGRQAKVEIDEEGFLDRDDVTVRPAILAQQDEGVAKFPLTFDVKGPRVQVGEQLGRGDRGV